MDHKIYYRFTFSKKSRQYGQKLNVKVWVYFESTLNLGKNKQADCLLQEKQRIKIKQLGSTLLPITKKKTLSAKRTADC